MQEKNGKVENGKEILEKIKDIKSTYEYDSVDQSEEELSFIDKINKLVQLILGDESASLFEVLNEKKIGEWHKKRFSRWIKRVILSNVQNTLYFIFLATITGFLVSEAVNFYAIGGVISTGTWVKAILTETSFIFLSGYKTSGKLQLLWVTLLRASVFTLMVFVISSQAIDTGTRTISENNSIAEQVEFIEQQVKEKDKQIAYYEKKDWPKNLTRTTIEKEALIVKLIKLKEEQASGKNNDVSKIEQYKMYGRAIFRILLLFISVLITRRIFIF